MSIIINFMKQDMNEIITKSQTSWIGKDFTS